MAGGRPPKPSLADAESPGVHAEARAPRRPQQRGRPASELYAELAALLPGIPSRASKVEVLEAALAQVKVLEDTAAVLEAYRALRSESDPAPRPRAEVASRDAVCFAVRLPPAPAPAGGGGGGGLRRVLEAFERRGVEVLAATVTGGQQVITVTADAAPPEVVEGIKADIAGIEWLP